MSLKKQYLASKSVCKVTFELSKDEANAAESAGLAGEFNNWDAAATPMRKSSAGDFAVTADLECGREFQYKYVLNGETWINDPAADKYVPAPEVGSDNSVVVVTAQAEEPKAAKAEQAEPPKATSKRAAPRRAAPRRAAAKKPDAKTEKAA